MPWLNWEDADMIQTSYFWLVRPHIKFQKSRNGLNDHKGQENINYTIFKCFTAT